MNADRRIKVQVCCLEDGIEPDVVRARIDQLKAEKTDAEAALAKLSIDGGDGGRSALRGIVQWRGQDRFGRAAR